MPLDDSIPFRALAGMQRAETYDPLAVQEQINRNQVLQGAAQKAQREAQAQQRLQQLSQQFGDDYDGLISAMAKEGYADKAVALSEGVWKSRGEAAKADQEQSKSSVQHLELGTRILQMANDNPELYPAARDWITKQAPQLSPLLPASYDKPTVDGVLQLGRTTKDYFDARTKAADLLINKDTRGSILTAFAGASNQQQWDSLMDGYKKLGLAPLLSLVGPTWSPEAQTKAAQDSISPEKKADDARQAAAQAVTAAGQAETARHNRVEEGLGAGNLAVRRQEANKPASAKGEGGRGVTSGDAGKLADMDASIAQLRELKGQFGGNNPSGLMANVETYLPPGLGTAAKSKQAKIDIVRQLVGKGLEGGVLRKEDEVKYAKILPIVSDNDALAASKIDGAIAAIEQKKADHLDSLQDAGYDTSRFRARQQAAPKKTGPGPKADPMGIRK